MGIVARDEPGMDDEGSRHEGVILTTFYTPPVSIVNEIYLSRLKVMMCLLVFYSKYYLLIPHLVFFLIVFFLPPYLYMASNSNALVLMFPAP